MSKEICKDCGRIINTDEDYYIMVDGEYVCGTCERDYRVCYECGEYFHTDNMVYTVNGWVCEDCANAWYEYCGECDEYVRDFDFDYDTQLCVNCSYRSIIHQYHHNKCLSTVFFKSCLEKAGLHAEPNYYLGVEWELCGRDIFNHAKELKKILGDRINFEEDCTVDVEGVFMPHSFEAIIESGEIKRAFDYADEHLDDEPYDAGLHIHVSRTAFGETEEEQEENIAKLAMLHQRGFAYEQLYKLSRRRDDEWCRPLSKWTSKSENEEYAKRFVHEGWNDHNIALNCGNSQTVEFRLGAGTVNYDNFIAWVKIVNMLVKKCREISMDDASNFYVWFEDADDSIKRYMEERGVVWEEPMTFTEKDYNRLLTTLMDKINADLAMNNANTMDYNTMLTALCNAPTQMRVALGYM